MRKMIVIVFAGVLLFALSGIAWAKQEESPDKSYDFRWVEFSVEPDKVAVPGAINGVDPGQVLFTIPPDPPGLPHPRNGFDYGEVEVDALANHEDKYFEFLHGNAAYLLVSFEGDPFDPNDTVVYFETPYGRRQALWSRQAFSNVGGAPDDNMTNLDGLEIYNQTGSGDDANRASFMGDPGGFSVWDWNGGAPVGFFPKTDVVAAITALGWSGDTVEIDVDALMTSGNEIIFSIRATGNWDGGELVVVTLGNPAGAAFLKHGDNTNHGDGTNKWNTAFDIQTAFGVDTEEVDAIEAAQFHGHHDIPTLTNWGLLILLVLLVISGIIVIRHRRKGVVRA